MHEFDATNLEAILERIYAQAATENIRITQHAQQEMVEEDITLDKVRCSVEGCPGEYEERQIVHTVRYHGQVVVIDHVPAEVCSVCGDVLLKPETVRRIEELLRTAAHPAKTVPLYEYA
jgi:YgiT-type zinc finger domain-containing protein